MRGLSQKDTTAAQDNPFSTFCGAIFMPNIISKKEIHRGRRREEGLNPERCKFFLRLRIGKRNQERCHIGDVDDDCGFKPELLRRCP